MSDQAPARHVRRSIPWREPPASPTEVSETARHRQAPPHSIEQPALLSFENLWNIARDALNIDPPLWVSSIFGLPWTWLPPFQRYSEFRIIDVWQPLRALKYLLDVSIPAIPRTPPEILPPVLDTFFYQPTVILQRPDQYGSYTSYPREKWFFINGIMTNDDVAQLNAAYLSRSVPSPHHAHSEFHLRPDVRSGGVRPGQAMAAHHRSRQESVPGHSRRVKERERKGRDHRALARHHRCLGRAAAAGSAHAARARTA